MKSFFKNVGVLMALLLTLTHNSYAESDSSAPQLSKTDSLFILHGNKMIDPRSIAKIDSIGKELFVKTGVNVYIYASEHYSDETFSDTASKMAFIKSFESKVVEELKEPFALITLSLDDTHVNLIQSQSLKSVIDKDKILNSYIVPLLASYDKNSVKAKVSAALINGYSSTAEMVAEAKGIKLDSAISGSGRTFAKIWKIFMYIIVLGGLLAYFYALWKDKRKSR